MSSLKVSSFGAYITSWKIGDKEVLYQGSELKRGGIPLLFPNFDAGEPLPRHGFARISQWQIITESEDFSNLKLTENDILPEYRQIYSYSFEANLKLKTIDNQLDYLLEIKNLDNKNLPLAPALHPYWPVNHGQKNQIILQNFPEFIPQNINWEKNPPDDTYNFNGNFEAIFPDYKLIIREISTDAQNNFHHLQVWSQSSNQIDHDFVCFEPATRPKNGINTDPILLTPKSTLNLHLNFEVTFR